MDFKNKIVVITGASSGIGEATAIDFAERGARLVLIARNMKRLEKVQKLCEDKGAKTLTLICDVSNAEDVKTTCEKIRKQFGHVDILINNAGFGVSKSFQDQSIADVESMMATNFFGTVYFIKELLEVMPKGSHIVNISSVAGKIAIPNFSGYNASKFAVSGFSEGLYYELQPKINVHLILPTGTKTRFFENDSFKKENILLSDLMQAEDVSKMIIDAIEKNRFETFPRLKESFYVKMRAIFPSFFMGQLKKRFLGK